MGFVQVENCIPGKNGGGGGTPYNGLYEEARTETGIFFRL